MAIEHPGDAASGLIAELGRKYIWWQPIGDAPHAQERIIAQAMDLGTFDDIRRLEDDARARTAGGRDAARRGRLVQRPLLGVLARPLVASLGQGDT